MARYLIAFGDPSALHSLDLSSPAADVWIPRGRTFASEQPPGICFKMLVGNGNSSDFSYAYDDAAGLLVLIDGLQASSHKSIDSSKPSSARCLAEHFRRTGQCPSSLWRDPVAFVILDIWNRQILAARDFFGTRPLYYSDCGDITLLSNDLQLVSAVPRVGRTLDPVAIADFLRYGLLDFFDKALTPFQSVRSLPPANILTRTVGASCRISRSRRFAELLDPVPAPSTRRIPGAFSEVMDVAVHDAVRGRRVLVSLSGGLDSGAIAACAATAFASDAPELLTTVTALAGPNDPEAKYSSLTASFLNLRHQYSILRSEHVLADSSPCWYPTMNLHDQSGDSEWTALLRCHDIALIGAAGDSVLCQEHAPIFSLLRRFGFAHAFRAVREAKRSGRRLGIGSGLAKMFGRTSKRQPVRIDIPFDVPEWLDQGLVSELGLFDRWTAHARWQPEEDLHPTHPQAQLWLQWANWAFSGGNIDPMAPALQMFDPFLDWRVISFCFSIPPEPWMHRKQLLRSAFESRLPPAVLQRPKTPAGNYVIKYLDEMDRQRLDAWSLASELSRFIRRERVPAFSPTAESRNGYLNLRPLMLQRWFDGLSQW